MKVGAHLMRFDSVAPARLRDELAATADAAEAAGLSWLSVMDHYFQMERAGFPREDPMLEAYTTLGFLAGRTSTVRLGVLVTGVTYRYPGLLAKIGATLDVLSGGRATMGLGAAWYDREHEALGVPFPPLKERFERLEETLRIAHQMWDGDESAFEGEHYQLERPLNSPPALRRPHPRILIEARQLGADFRDQRLFVEPQQSGVAARETHRICPRRKAREIARLDHRQMPFGYARLGGDLFQAEALSFARFSSAFSSAWPSALARSGMKSSPTDLMT